MSMFTDNTPPRSPRESSVTSYSVAEESDDDRESEVEHIFLVGWAEEMFYLYSRIRNLASSAERALHPTLHLFETKKNEAVFQALCPGFPEQEDTHRGEGLLLKPVATCTPEVYLSQFSLGYLGAPRSVTVLRRVDHKPVKALTFSKYFPNSFVSATLVSCGSWLERPRPFPLVSVSAETLQSIRSIFAYGTLRHDDTSGASWTKPFNEGMTSQPAVVRGLSLYLQGFPIVLVPRDSTQPNEGVVGCIASADPQCSLDEFSAKLQMADRIEGTPKEYRRGVVKAELKDGTEVLAFIYYKEPSQIHDLDGLKRTRIASGNYLRRGPKIPFQF